MEDKDFIKAVCDHISKTQQDLQEASLGDALGKALIAVQDLGVDDLLEVAYSILMKAVRAETGTRSEKIRKLANSVSNLNN